LIIDGKKIARVTITGPDETVVAVLTDKEAKTEKGYSVSVILDTSPGPDAIALAGDVLYYMDDPEQVYVVTQADDKFFSMTPVTTDFKKQTVEYDNRHTRVYPNNCKVGTLEDYGIALDYRGSDGNGSTQNDENHPSD
jgi:hypothetical protein